MNPNTPNSDDSIDLSSSTGFSRRNFIGTTASGLITTAVTGTALAQAADGKTKVIRWGFIGTGSIANSMARTLKNTPAGKLVASSSRSLEKAESFAKKHGADKAFDSWQEMIKWDGIDAVAAKAGKHVIGEKPFATFESVKRITKACQENNVAFMDGTHFSHHPRTTALRNDLNSIVGERRHVHSVFQFRLGNTSNIRMQPKLEPMGAIGDVGWYNMRAIVDYLAPGIKLVNVSAHLRRSPETGAAIGAAGLLSFSDGSSSTWACGFDAGVSRSNLVIDGNKGGIDIDNFIRQDKDNSASYHYRSKGGKNHEKADKKVRVESKSSGSSLMFEDFAAQVHDKTLRTQWAQKTLRTQELLDAVWEAATKAEK